MNVADNTAQPQVPLAGSLVVSSQLQVDHSLLLPPLLCPCLSSSSVHWLLMETQHPHHGLNTPPPAIIFLWSPLQPLIPHPILLCQQPQIHQAHPTSRPLQSLFQPTQLPPSLPSSFFLLQVRSSLTLQGMKNSVNVLRTLAGEARGGAPAAFPFLCSNCFSQHLPPSHLYQAAPCSHKRLSTSKTIPALFLDE